MIGYWFYKFSVEDRDIGVVDYESFENTDIDLPILSICVKNPFHEKKIRLLDPHLNGLAYLKYLIGAIDEVKFHDIEYENVSIDINEYFSSVRILYRNESSATIRSPRKRHVAIFDGIDHTGYFVKCFSHELDTHERVNIVKAKYYYNISRLFSDLGNSIRKDQRMILGVYYPGQFLMKMGGGYILRTSGRNDIAGMFIQDIEFLKSRKKRSRDCMVDWKSYDSLVLKKHIEENGCIAPYHGSYDTYARCRNKTEMKRYLYSFSKVKEIYHIFSPYDDLTDCNVLISF